MNAATFVRRSASSGDRFLAGMWIAIVAALFAFLIYSVWLLWLPLLVGYLLATLLAPLLEQLDRRGFPRSLSTAGLLGSLAALLVVGGILATPLAVAQIDAFRAQSGTYMEIASSRMTGFVEFLSTLVPQRELEHVRQLALRRLATQGRPFQSLQELLDVLPVVENAVLTVVVAFFLLARGPEIRKAFMGLIPNRYFEMTLRLLYRVQRQTSDYLRGQCLDSIANAVLISAALSLLGVPYAIFIGAFAGFANVVPLLGPIAGGIPAVALALVGAAAAPWWLIVAVLTAIHLLDNLVIYPATVGGSLHLPAWVVILGLALGSHLGGIVGMLVAVPVIGLLRGLVIELHASLKGFRII